MLLQATSLRSDTCATSKKLTNNYHAYQIMATYVYSSDIGKCLDWLIGELNQDILLPIVYVNNTLPDRIINHINGREGARSSSIPRDIERRDHEMTREGNQDGLIAIEDKTPQEISINEQKSHRDASTETVPSDILKHIDYRKVNNLYDVIALLQSNSVVVVENFQLIVKSSPLDYATVNHLLVRICQNKGVIILDDVKNMFMIQLVGREIEIS